jgi:hypothetical protein
MFAALAIAGAAMSAYSMYQQGQNAKEAAAQNAAYGALAAAETRFRGEENIKVLQQQGAQVVSSQQATYRGISLQGAQLTSMRETAYKVAKDVTRKQRELDYAIRLSEMEGRMGMQAADRLAQGATIGSIGSLIGNIGQTMRSSPRYGQETPKTSTLTGPSQSISLGQTQSK